MAVRKKAAVKRAAPKTKVLKEQSHRVETVGAEPVVSEEEVPQAMVIDRPPERPAGRVIKVTYAGGGFDHAVTPGVHKIGKDHKPIKRRYLKPAVTKFHEIDTYKLWGFEFPKGESVEIGDNHGLFIKGQINIHMLTQKLLNLRVFEIEAPDELMAPIPKKQRRRG